MSNHEGVYQIELLSFDEAVRFALRRHRTGGVLCILELLPAHYFIIFSTILMRCPDSLARISA